MQDAFFKATQNALSSLTSLTDIIHPITVSMWNTRAQVIGTYAVIPNATPHQIAAKYGLGSGIHGVNYKRVFKETPWDRHEESIAWLFLNSIIPIYEGWLETLNSDVFTSANGNISVESMQFPKPRSKGNAIDELTRLTLTESSIIKDAFYVKYSSRKYRCLSQLNNLLICYRYFKQMRNCYMHNNMIADSALLNVYRNFANLLNPSDLNMTEIPKHFPPIANSQVHLSLRGVIGFFHVVLQILVTCDAELSRSVFSEKEMLDRLSKIITTPITINGSKERAFRQIDGIFKSAGFISPNHSSMNLLIPFLIDNRFIYPVVIK